MHNRDPRKKSRTNRKRLTSSSDRSRRSKASSKDTPRPTSSADRPKTKGSASSRVTTATKGVKKNAWKANRGAQGPRRAPTQGPVRPTPMHKGRGMGIVAETGKPKAAPKAGPPKLGKVRTIKTPTKGVRGGKAAGSALGAIALGALAANLKGDNKLRGPVTKAKQKEKAQKSNAEKDRRRKRQLGNKSGPEAPPSYKPKIYKKPSKGKTVMAKKDGRTGYMRDGKFYPRKWSTAQTLKYKARGGN